MHQYAASANAPPCSQTLIKMPHHEYSEPWAKKEDDFLKSTVEAMMAKKIAAGKKPTVDWDEYDWENAVDLKPAHRDKDKARHRLYRIMKGQNKKGKNKCVKCFKIIGKVVLCKGHSCDFRNWVKVDGMWIDAAMIDAAIASVDVDELFGASSVKPMDETSDVEIMNKDEFDDFIDNALVV